MRKLRDSIEIGLPGPKANVTLTVFTGLGLHAAAERSRRRNRGSDPVFAALACGANIIIHAALLLQPHHQRLRTARF